MTSSRTLAFWAAVLTAALLALLSPFAHACPFDPRWLTSSPDDSDLDDVVHLVLASAGTPAGTPAIAPPPRVPLGLVAEVGSGYISSAPGRICPTRAPPRLLARSI